MKVREQGHCMRVFLHPPIPLHQSLDLGLGRLAWGRLGSHQTLLRSLDILCRLRMGQLPRTKGLQTRRNQKQVLHRMEKVSHRKELADLLACHRRGLLPHMKGRQVQNMLELVVNHTLQHPLQHM